MVVSAVLEGCLVISFGFVEFIGRARDTRQSSVDGFGDRFDDAWRVVGKVVDI